MPELPEVEFARTCLERWIGGQKLVDVSAPQSRILRGSSVKALAKLEGHRLLHVRRHGKWLLFQFDRDAGLVGHLGMTGKFVREEEGVDVRWSRARFEAADGTAVHFQDSRMFGRLAPGNYEELLEKEGVSALGPDAWDSPLPAKALWERLSARKRAVKDVLMDQTVLAGIGNIQATEALWQARIHPNTPASKLTLDDAKVLARAIHWTLARTLKMNKGDKISYVEEGEVENPFRIYGKAEEPCPRCGAPIESMVIGGRTSAFCPVCQPRPRAR